MPSICKYGSDCSKRAIYGVKGGKAERCAGHAEEGMIDNHSKKCAHQGCNKGPYYGVAGTKKREFCSEHAKEGLVDLSNKKCARRGCSKCASFGVAGTKKQEFCAGHAQEGMVDLIHTKKCAYQGCSKGPSYGVAGTKKREFCSQHAKRGMIDLISKKCAHQGCSKRSAKKREFCSEHAKDGMVPLHSKADGVRGGIRGRGASTARVGLGVAGTSTVLATPAGSGTSNVNRAQASRKRKGRAPPSTQPRNGRGDDGQASGSSSNSSGSSKARRPRAPVVPPRLLMEPHGPAIVGKDPPSPPQPPTEDGRDTSTNDVKTEEVTFSTSLVIPGVGPIGEEGAVANRVGNRCGKRKGCAQPSSGGANSDETAAALGQGSTSSNRRCGKRSRRGIDDDVFVLEAGDEGFPDTSQGVAHKGEGASVAIKPER